MRYSTKPGVLTGYMGVFFSPLFNTCSCQQSGHHSCQWLNGQETNCLKGSLTQEPFSIQVRLGKSVSNHGCLRMTNYENLVVHIHCSVVHRLKIIFNIPSSFLNGENGHFMVGNLGNPRQNSGRHVDYSTRTNWFGRGWTCTGCVGTL